MPECGYCKDCRHWGASDLPAHGRYRDCLGFHELYEGDDHASQAEKFGENAYLTAASESHDMLTAPDFGCLKFEPKET